MTGHATPYSRVKAGLCTRLNALPGLEGVVVAYDPPVQVPDVRGATGAWENLHFAAEATGETDEVVFCGPGELSFDVDYTQPMVVQVLRPSSLGTQQACDERAEEILREVYIELSGQHGWDLAAIDLDWLDYLIITPGSFAWGGGRLGGSGGGHASSVRLGLQVQARGSFSP